MDTYIRTLTTGIVRELTPIVSRYIHRVRNFNLHHTIKRELALSPLKQNLLIASIGFYVFMVGFLGSADPLVQSVFAGVGAITMVYGIILALLLLIKGTFVESIRATQLLYRIRLHAARRGSILRVVLNESDKATGVRVLYILIIFSIGLYVLMSV